MNNEYKDWIDKLEEEKLIKIEAYKEFADKIKRHARKMNGYDLCEPFWDYAVLVEDIDSILKGMIKNKVITIPCSSYIETMDKKSAIKYLKQIIQELEGESKDE